MFEALKKACKIFQSSFDQTALLPGVSDVIVTIWNTGQIKSTPFLVCFGSEITAVENRRITVSVGGNKINDVNFHVDKYGYLQPMKPSNQMLSKLNLAYGKNHVTFTLGNSCNLQCQIYFYHEDDKILVSDVDGTLTKSDLPGLYNNLFGTNYLHQGYAELLQKMDTQGYNIVWLTMRALPLYGMSKQYIKTHTNVEGPLFMEPEQFLTAVKKQVTKQTGNVKTNMMRVIRETFPSHVDPFIGGLGNRQNDAIAYRAAGVNNSNIYIIDTQSVVQKISKTNTQTTYRKMSQDIFMAFPHENVDLFKSEDFGKAGHKNRMTKMVKKMSSMSTTISDRTYSQRFQQITITSNL